VFSLAINYWCRKQRYNYQLVVTVVMKNCEPLVSGPAFAIDKNPVGTENDKNKNQPHHRFIWTYD